MKVIYVNAEQDPDKPYEPDGSQEKPYKTYKEAVEAALKHNMLVNIHDVPETKH